MLTVATKGNHYERAQLNGYVCSANAPPFELCNLSLSMPDRSKVIRPETVMPARHPVLPNRSDLSGQLHRMTITDAQTSRRIQQVEDSRRKATHLLHISPTAVRFRVKLVLVGRLVETKKFGQ